MRWISYTSKGEGSDSEATIVSLLAIFETLSIFSLILGIAIYRNDFSPILFSVIIAPLLLLRSDTSTALGREYYKKINVFMEETFQVSNGNTFVVFIKLITFYPLYFIATFLLRFCATFRYAFVGLKFIPQNWFRVVFCTDFLVKPEIVPGTGVFVPNLNHKDFDISDFRKFIYFMSFAILSSLTLYLISLANSFVANKDLSLLAEIFLLLSLSAVFVTFLVISILYMSVCLGYMLCVIGSIMYRISIKSTAPVWIPLIYSSVKAFKKIEVRELIDEYCFSGKSHVGRVFSWLIVGLSVLKFFVIPGCIDVWNKFILSEFLNYYLMPGEIHIWHVANLFLAVLNLAYYYFFLERIESRLEFNRWSEETIFRVDGIYRFVVTLVSMYTILVSILITIKVYLEMNGPSLELNLFPEGVNSKIFELLGV